MANDGLEGTGPGIFAILVCFVFIRGIRDASAKDFSMYRYDTYCRFGGDTYYCTVL